MSTVAVEQEASFACTLPHTIEDLGIPASMVHDLVTRRIYLDGTTTIRALSERLKMSPIIVQEVFRTLRDQRLIDVRSSSGDDYIFSMTKAGQRLAANRMKVCQYAGPAPVSLSDYVTAVEAQRPTLNVGAEDIRTALSDLVLEDDLVRKLGPAVLSQRSIFLYGGTGNGKTCIGERLHRLYTDTVLIPYAVEVDGQIILVYDPVVHKPTGGEEEFGADPRWVRCERPRVIVGGEMTAAMLELRLDDASRTYAAPCQMKANMGLLLIDDFGRQSISPRKLLNRWVVPLDRRVDYLTLEYGVKFSIPFELMVVFATNLEPHHLADEAFLRRFHNKIYVGPVKPEVFDEIFRQALERLGMTAEEGAAKHLRERVAAEGCPELRACLPGDLASIASWVIRFEQRPAHITHAELDRAIEVYFTRPIDVGEA